jgi:glycine cleavage system regulatory protein
MRKRIWILLLLTGCGESAELAAMKASFEAAGEEVIAKQDESLTILRDNTTALAAIKSQVESLNGNLLETRQAIGTMEASLVKSEAANSQEVIKSALEPQAIERNSQHTPSVPRSTPAVRSSGPVKLSWNIDGNWNPTIIETANHLRDEHGVNIDGMTHQQLHDLHASLHNGTASKPVAVKSYPAQTVNQGTYCPNGQCPMPQQVKVKRRR